MNRTKITGLIAMFGIMVLAAVSSFAEVEYPQIEGVFGIAPVTNSSAMAIWVPLGQGEAVSGIHWFNNDEDTIFPEFLAVAGDYGYPELLVTATSVGQNVSGNTDGWVTHQFTQPIASESSGLYLLIKLPEGEGFEFNGLGGGPGIGYVAGGNYNNCWITGDGEKWDSLAVSFQMAIVPEMTGNKSGDVLVLARPDGLISQPLIEEQDKVEVPVGLRAVPNPFNPETSISFSLPMAGMVDLSVFDIRGHLVRNLVHDSLSAGDHSISWNGKDSSGRSSASGVYFVKMSSGSLRLSSRITLVQ